MLSLIGRHSLKYSAISVSVVPTGRSDRCSKGECCRNPRTRTQQDVTVSIEHRANGAERDARTYEVRVRSGGRHAGWRSKEGSGSKAGMGTSRASSDVRRSSVGVGGVEGQVSSRHRFLGITRRRSRDGTGTTRTRTRWGGKSTFGGVAHTRSERPQASELRPPPFPPAQHSDTSDQGSHLGPAERLRSENNCG